MLKHIVTLSAAALCASCAWGVGASQEWVKDYISRLNGGTNAVLSADAGTNGVFTATYELFTVAALVATNSAHATVTNGFTFAYTSNGVYRCGQQTIQATASNLVWNGVSSVVSEGFDTFSGNFSVFGTKIAPSRAREVAP